MPCAVILTAIPIEYMAVRAHLTNLEEKTHPQGTIYERGKFSSFGKSWDVGIVEIGAGNAGAAMEAERAIAYFQPSVVFFVGVAGGIKEVKLGDVVAATKVYGYESGKAKLEFEPRPDVGLSTYDMIQRARAEARKPDWQRRLTSNDSTSPPHVFVAPIAAGEKVVASMESSTFEFLRKNYGDAIAVEMEGRGLLQAAIANQQVSALIIRGISDLIEGKSEADATGLMETAARHASAFAFEVLAKLDGVPLSPKPIDHKESSTATGGQKGKKSQIQIFLAHASEDSSEVLKLYDSLKQRGYKPWLDKKDLVPGQNWREEIPKAIRQSDIFIACLSHKSVSKQGYVQREFRQALNEYAEKTPGTIYLIPLKLNDCEIPELQLAQLGVNLRDVHWLDYWEPNGFENLVRAIEHQFRTDPKS